MIAAGDILQEAVQLHERGEFQQSESLCRQVLRIDPGHHDALYLLGLTAVAQNRSEEAIQKFEQLACLCPHSADVYARLAQAYAAASLLEEAAAAYWKAIERRPRDARLYVDLGILLQRLGETAGAIACFQQARELQPASTAAIHNLAVILEVTGRRGEAITMLQAALQSLSDADLHCTLAALLQQDGRIADAYASLNRALQINPDCVTALYEVGERLRIEQQFPAALQKLQRAIVLAPEHAEAHVACGHVLVMLSRSAQALPVLQKAVALHPNSADALAGLGHALRDLGRTDEACDAYWRALDIDPAATGTRFLLAKTLARADRHHEAIEQFHIVQEREPRLPQLDRQLAASLKILGRYDDALAAFQRAAARETDSAAVWYELGNLHRHRREFQAARSAYERSLQLDPHQAAALIALANVLKTLDETDAAAEAYGQVLRRLPDRAPWELWIAALCPAVFDSSAAIDDDRERLRRDLERVAATGLKLTAADIATSACPVPYHLQFHGRDDLPLKRAYARVFETALDEDGLGRPSRIERPKVGFVVTAGHEVVFLRYLGDILRRMTYGEFDAEVLCAASGSELIRRHLKTDRIRLREIPSRLDTAVDAIREESYDVLYHWEVGSDVTNYFLPFFRLAPLQCTGPGLPVTSGIAAMDCFLSTGFVEPPGADDHYSEVLIRGETLLTCQPRIPLSKSPKSRDDFGFRTHEHIYLCPHKIEKFHPDFDALLAGILRRDPAGRMVVPGDREHIIVRKLHARWERTMPDVLNRVTMLPHQPFDDYLSLTAAADVLLDPLHYGGGLTAFDGFSLNQPIVTLPGRFVRGRYTFGCYQLMGIDDCIASSMEEYVAIAVRLGTDADFRRDGARRIAAASDVLFDNQRAVAEHEEIFNRLIAEARTA